MAKAKTLEQVTDYVTQLDLSGLLAIAKLAAKLISQKEAEEKAKIDEANQNLDLIKNGGE